MKAVVTSLFTNQNTLEIRIQVPDTDRSRHRRNEESHSGHNHADGIYHSTDQITGFYRIPLTIQSNRDVVSSSIQDIFYFYLVLQNKKALYQALK